jgi:ABC-type glutathione transport system ATPase component
MILRAQRATLKQGSFVATIVRYHGAGPWHLNELLTTDKFPHIKYQISNHQYQIVFFPINQMPITFNNVSKHFANTSVVDNLSLEINDGEFVVLLGPSGCGKTTTLRMLAGLEEVSAGDIYVDQQRNGHSNPASRFGDGLSNYALYPHMTIAENIAYPLRVRKVNVQERNQRVYYAFCARLNRF